MTTCYHPSMSGQNDNNLINFIASTVETMREQMATKDDLVRLESRMEIMREQMATKDDLAAVKDDLAAVKDDLAAVKDDLSAVKDDLSAVKDDLSAVKDDLSAVKDQMVTKDDLATVRSEMATKNDLGRLETTMHGEFEQVHIRLDSLDRRTGTRMAQIEGDVSRLRSVVYLLIKDQPEMLRLLGQPTPRENQTQD